MTGRDAKCVFRGFAVAYAAAALTCAAQTATTEAPIEKTFTEGDVKLEISIDPATVDLGRDTIVLIHLAHPEGIDVDIPEEMSGRFEGFDLAGYYSTPRAPAGGLASTTHNFRLTPIPGAERYRIRPFAVITTDTSVHPAAKRWFSTEIISIPSGSTASTAPGTVSTSIEPVYIRTSFRKLPRILGGIALLAGVVLTALWSVSRIRISRKIRRMTPRERAFHELARLLSRKLAEKGQFKDFYIELTMVVRRYIERSFGIRAPRQTTEEFLSKATGREEFSTESIALLKQFLSAADLVKFAGVSATIETAAEAVAKARGYLESEPSQLDSFERKDLGTAISSKEAGK